MDDEKAKLRSQAETIRALRLALADIEKLCQKEAEYRQRHGYRDSWIGSRIMEECGKGKRALVKYTAESERLRLEIPEGQMKLKGI